MGESPPPPDECRRIWAPLDPGSLLTGGDDEHRQHAASVGGRNLSHIASALGLIGYVLESAGSNMRGNAFPNDLGSLACFTRAFRDLRAATLLAMTGYSSASRAVLRSAYEAAGLGRLLSHQPQLAEKWLRNGRWVPDREVRRDIEAQTISQGEGSQLSTDARVRGRTRLRSLQYL